MNSLVEKYRSRVPDDPRSDEELTLMFGRTNDQDGRYNSYPDFVAQYKQLTAPPELSLKAEAVRGFDRGVNSLKESAYGLGALGADLVGATDARDAMLARYAESQAESSTDRASSVPRVEDVKDLSSGLKFAASKVGELVPQIGEALVTGAAGALAGSAVAPGPGTAAGGAAGVVEGFVARQSAKAIIKVGIDKLLTSMGRESLDAAGRAIVKDQIESVAAKQAIKGTIHPVVEKLLADQIKSSAANMGSFGANLVNFYGIGAGTIYGDLGNREGVDKGDARAAALIGGIGSALANAPLPTVVLSRYFPGVGSEVAQKYISRLAKDAALEIPLGAGTEALDELVQIAAEKYADPKRRNTGLDDQDLSRLLNAAVVGAGAGGMVAPISAIPGPRPVFDPSMEKRYWGDLPDDRKKQLAALATREDLGTLSEGDRAALSTLQPEENNFIVAYRSLSDTEKKRYDVQMTSIKEVIPDGKKDEGQREEGLLKTDTATGIETVPVVSEDQAKELKKLGYDDTDVSVLDGKAAQNIIDTKTESHKKIQKNTIRASAISRTPTESASDAALRKKLDEAGRNTNPKPTVKEAEAETYQMGEADINGIVTIVETPRGEVRQGKDKTGKPWHVVLKHDYGKMKGTKSADKAELDITWGPNPGSPHYWVIDQIDPETLDYDEAKSFAGFETPEEVLAAYKSQFSDGSSKKRMGHLTEMTREEFDLWRFDGERSTKALQYVKPKVEADTTTATKPKKESKPKAEKPASDNPASIGLELQKGDLGKQGYYKVVHEGINSGSVRIEPGLISLINVRAEESGKGVGGAWLEKLKKFGDDTKRRIELIAKADSEELQPKLEKFYDKHGFTLKDEESRTYEYDGQKPAKKVEKPVEVKPEIKPDAVTGKYGGETRPITAADVDVENRATFGSSKRGKTKADSIVQPAWFRVKKGTPLKQMFEQLLSDRGTPGDAAKTKTARLTAILDRMTDMVHLVSTFGSSADSLSITIFDEDVRPKGQGAKKGDKSVKLGKVLTDHTNYEVLGSIRTKELTEFFHQQMDRDQFESEFAEPLQQAVDEVQRKAKNVADSGTIDKKTKKKQGAPEETGHSNFHPPGHVDLSDNDIFTLLMIPDWNNVREFIKVLKGLTDEQRDLIQRMRSADVDPDFVARVSQDGIEQTLINYDKANEESGSGTDYTALVRRHKRIADKKEKAGVRGAPARGGQGSSGSAPTVAGKQGGARKPKQTGDAGDKKPDTTSGEVKIGVREKDLNSYEAKRAIRLAERAEKMGDAAEGERLRKVAAKFEDNWKQFGDDSRSDPETGEAINKVEKKVVEPKTEDDFASNMAMAQQMKMANHPEADVRGFVEDFLAEPGWSDEIKASARETMNRWFSKPEDRKMQPVFEQTGETDPVFERMLDGIYTTAAQQGMNARVVRGALPKGSYSPANRMVTQTIGAAIGSNDIRVAIHEVGHHVFSMLPRELRDHIMRAIGSISDAGLGIVKYPDARFLDGTMAELPNQLYQEERLVSSVEAKLNSEGFNPRDAATYAQTFVRAVKSAIIRAVLEIQKMLGHEASESLAQEYFKLSVQKFLAGDAGRFSYLDMMGLAKPSVANQHGKFFASEANTERLYGEDVLYGHADNNDYKGADFNIDNALRFTIPAGTASDMRATQTNRIEREVATLNHLIDLHNDAAAALASNEAAAKRLKEAGRTPIQWLRKFLKLPDPEAAKSKLDGRLEPDGSEVVYDEEKRIDQFKDESNKDYVLEKVHRDAQKFSHKLDAAIRDHEAGIQAIADKKQKVAERVADGRKRYADLDAQAKLLQKKINDQLADMLGLVSGANKRSMIAATLKVLDQQNKPATYAKAFEKMVADKSLTGERMIKVLDLAASIPAIDFKAKADEIRKAMRESGKFESLMQATPVSKAALATVITVARMNPRLMAELELRRLPDGRAAIEGKVDKMIAGELKWKSKKGLNRQSPIEDRILAEYSKEAKDARDIAKDEAKLKGELESLRLVEPVSNKRMDELTGQLGVVQDFTFKDQAEYYVAKAGMTTEQVLKAKEVLALDSSGRPTRADTLKRQVEDMKRFLMEREEKFRAGDLAAKDRAYQRVQLMYQEIAKNLHYDTTLTPSNRWGIELYLMPAFSRIADAFSTPAAQLFKRAGYHFARIETNLRQIGDGIYDKDYRMRRELHRLLPGLDDDNLQHFINSAKFILEENTADLAETYAGDEAKIQRLAYARVRNSIANSRIAKDIGLDKVMDRFMPTFEKIVEFEHEMGNRHYMGQVTAGVRVKNPVTNLYEDAGLKVKDPNLKVMDDEGNQVTALRRHTKKGWRTFGGRRMSADFNNMVYSMKKSDWATFHAKLGGDKLAKLHQEDPEAARRELNRFFNSIEHGKVVRDWFLRKLAESDQAAMFDAPAMADGETITPAEPDLVRRAYNAVPEGDVLAWIEKMYDLHEGESDLSAFVQQTADRLGEYWDNVHDINEQYFPDDGKANPMNTIQGMTPGALVDARKVGGLPSEWFSFYKFDKPSLHKLSRLIASEVAFGRNAEYLQGLIETVEKEVTDARNRLDAKRAEVRAQHPSWTGQKNKIEREVEKMADYKKLKAFEDRAGSIKQTIHDLSAFFRKDNSPEATLWLGTRMAQTISRLMVNNPGSAMYQLAALFDPLFRYGVSPSTLKATGRGIKRHVEESVASLMQSFGVQVFNGGDFNDRFNRLNLQFPERIKRFGDEFRRWENESRGSYAARLVEEVTSSPLNLKGREMKHVQFRPTGLFDWTSMIADKSLTDGMWTFVGNFVSKGVEHLRSHPEKLNDKNYKLTAADLGLGKISGDANAFKQLQADMQNFGMNYDEMVRGGMKRGDGTVFTDEEALRLNAMAMFLVSSQSNVATMTPAAWNNNILRWMIPLLGWAWRRTLDVTGKRLSPEGKLQAAAIVRGVGGLAAASVGGLALSAMVDKYYEDFVGRKRNLRPITSALGVIEHTARVGSTGFFGELINGAVNVGTGADNRMLSLDRRVVAVSSALAIQNAVSNWINQEQADYNRVYRPIFMAIGGNGMLQYIDMINNLSGFDNIESRISNRINAQNYLRVIGRELEMPVRMVGAAGAGTPTPMTPYITQMEMATYANDAAGFRNAYREAVAAAKEQGFEDPVDHVKRSFAAKNPLRQVFSVTPSASDYRRILLALSENGRAAVSDAVANFNRYSESIGGRPFTGRVDKGVNPRTATGTTGFERLTTLRQAAFAR